MTAFAPASTSILTVPSPRPEAPPVTINVLPLSCMGSPSSLLRALLLLRHQPRAVAQQRIQAALRDEISPALELFLALHLLDQLLAPFLELLVVLRLVFRLLALRGSARLAGLAGHRHPDVVIVARLLADSQGIAQAVEGIGLDDDRMIKPDIGLGGVGDHVDEIHPAERAREVGRLLQIGLFLRSAEFPVRRLGLARHAPALSSVLRRRNRLRAVGPKQILHHPPLGPGLDFGQRLPDCEHRRGFAARDEVAARRLGLTARERSDRRALHDFLSEQEAPERATLGVLKLDQCTGARHLALRLEQLQANALALGQGFALNDLQLGELHEKRRDAIGVGGEAGALAYAPAGLAAREVQLAARVGNCDLGDLAQVQARDRLLPRTRIGARPGGAVGQHDCGTRGGEDREHRERDEELPAVHIAGVLRRRRIARPMPASVTSRGISAMLSTLVQNWRASLSARSSRRTSFSARRVSAAFLRKFSSSVCCSAVRIAPAPCPLPLCSALSFSCVCPRLSSNSLILPR